MVCISISGREIKEKKPMAQKDMPCTALHDLQHSPSVHEPVFTSAELTNEQRHCGRFIGSLSCSHIVLVVRACKAPGFGRSPLPVKRPGGEHDEDSASYPVPVTRTMARIPLTVSAEIRLSHICL